MRKARTFVDYLTLSLLLRMPMILYVDAQPKCMEVTYLEVGKEGIISCSLEPFYAVSWYTKEDYDEEKSPLLYFNGNKHGRVNEYDVHPNGSFIFRNVSLNHAGSYTVTMLEDVTSDLFVREVQLGVYVTPDPTYPVVEGRIMQQHVYMDANRNGQLSCSMRRVYPNISLVWTVVDPTQSKKILFQEDVVGRKQNEDNTFDITLTSLYEVTDQSVPRITIQCGVANEIGEVLSSRTKVDLLFSSVYPVVNGHVNQRHVYLDVDREGNLTCIKENVDAGTTLVWKIVDPSMQEQITFQSREIVSNNNDGTVTINQTFDYERHDLSLDRITIECAVVTRDTDDIPLATKVDLLFQNVYPVVNGHVNQKHVYLDVDRKGHLTCIKESVDAGTTLVWKIVDRSMWEKITFQSREIVLNNNDGTVTINQTFDYEINDHSVDRITIECEVTPDTDDIPLATKVDLLFENVYPVVNGHVKQKHVYLDVDREGHLTCIKENVDAGTTLVWKIVDTSMHDRISFQSNAFISHNKDDTININQTFDYIVHDITLERVALECRVIEPDTDEHPYVTQAELLLGNAHFHLTVAVIDGCYSKQDLCVLKVERTGQLTCTVKNSRYPVILNWIVLDGGPSFDLGESVVSSQNNSDLFDTSVTTAYTITDESESSVSVQCVAMSANSGHLLSIAEASLGVYSVVDSSSKSLHGTVIAFSVTTIFVVIAFGVIVIILLCCNRKMYKQKCVMKCLTPECGEVMFGYSIPQESTGPTKWNTDAGLPVSCDSEAAFNMSEDTDQDKSSESPDSGNSGSTSGERNGSEAPEKCSLMICGESWESSSMQAQMTSEENNPEKLPMIHYKDEHDQAKNAFTVAL